eukprot:5389956-Pyramimonas_sp.AAC.1
MIDSFINGATAAVEVEFESFDPATSDRIVADAAKCNGLSLTESVTALIPKLVGYIVTLCVEKKLDEGLTYKAADCINQLSVMSPDSACPCNLWAEFLKML